MIDASGHAVGYTIDIRQAVYTVYIHVIHVLTIYNVSYVVHLYVF